MASIDIVHIIESDLDREIQRALTDAVKKVIPNSKFDSNELFREFVRSMHRTCSTWETVGDQWVMK